MPLYNSTGVNCTGNGDSSCNADIEEQPVNLTTLSGRYAAYAERYLQLPAGHRSGTHVPPVVDDVAGPVLLGCRFISEQAGGEQPFFLYMAMSHMHVPLAHDPRFDNVSRRTDRQVFGDTLAEGECHGRNWP